MEWSAISPDLTLPDLFLWGGLKTLVNKTPLQDIQERRITKEYSLITGERYRKFENNLK